MRAVFLGAAEAVRVGKIVHSGEERVVKRVREEKGASETEERERAGNEREGRGKMEPLFEVHAVAAKTVHLKPGEGANLPATSAECVEPKGEGWRRRGCARATR